MREAEPVEVHVHGAQAYSAPLRSDEHQLPTNNTVCDLKGIRRGGFARLPYPSSLWHQPRCRLQVCPAFLAAPRRLSWSLHSHLAAVPAETRRQTLLGFCWLHQIRPTFHKRGFGPAWPHEQPQLPLLRSAGVSLLSWPPPGNTPPP